MKAKLFILGLVLVSVAAVMLTMEPLEKAAIRSLQADAYVATHGIPAVADLPMVSGAWHTTPSVLTPSQPVMAHQPMASLRRQVAVPNRGLYAVSQQRVHTSQGYVSQQGHVQAQQRSANSIAYQRPTHTFLALSAVTRPAAMRAAVPQVAEESRAAKKRIGTSITPPPGGGNTEGTGGVGDWQLDNTSTGGLGGLTPPPGGGNIEGEGDEDDWQLNNPLGGLTPPPGGGNIAGDGGVDDWQLNNAPLGDSLLFLFLLAVAYAIFCRPRIKQNECYSHP